jgi:hypothetical protein
VHDGVVSIGRTMYCGTISEITRNLSESRSASAPLKTGHVIATLGEPKSYGSTQQA